MFLRLIAWLTNGEVVYLKDYVKKVHKSIAYKTPFGDIYCYVYPITHVGHVILLPNGKVDPNSQSSYIKAWVKG